MRTFWLAGLALLVLHGANPALAQQAAPGPQAGPRPGYTDLADLVLASPVILHATVSRASRLGRRAAPDVPAGEVRVLVEARLAALLRGDGLVPARAEWLWQGPTSAVPARGTELIAFLAPAGEGPRPDVAQYRLTSVRGQMPHDPALESRVRQILREAAGGVPRVRGVKAGFHVPGSIQGESESQFFLDMADGAPITLVVLRRPGAAPDVRVATGDLIDESAAPIQRETLVWRTLACDLPSAPPASVAGDPGLAQDYAAI
ncbi:MAG: hypothetical protein SNJ63_09090, partial [Sphingomonadaceae bacterium]